MNFSRGRSTCGPTARNASDRHRYSKNSRNESRRIDAQERAEAHPGPHGRRGPTFSERLCSSSLTAAVCTPTLRDRRTSLSCTSLTRSFTEMEMLTFPLDAAFANCRFYSSSLLFPPHTIPLTSEQSGLHGAPQSWVAPGRRGPALFKCAGGLGELFSFISVLQISCYFNR